MITAVEPPEVATPTSVLLTIHRNDWFGIFADVEPFVSTDAVFPMLNAFQVNVSGSTIKVVGTDRYAMARRVYDLPNLDATPVTVLMPLDEVKAMRRIHAPAPRGIENMVDVTITADAITITSNKGNITSRHLTSSALGFPDVDSFLPDDPKTVATEQIMWDPGFMAKFAKVKRLRDTRMRVRFAGPARAIRIDIGDYFSGALMPVRLES
jgi:hypothetical protein